MSKSMSKSMFKSKFKPMSKFPFHNLRKQRDPPSFRDESREQETERVEDDLAFASERAVHVFAGEFRGRFQCGAAEEALFGDAGAHLRVGGHRARCG